MIGDSVSSTVNADTVIEGHAQLRKIDTVIKANRITYNQTTDHATAVGDVLINRGGNRYWGSLLDLDVTAFQGFFDTPSYQFLRNGATGSADRVNFVSERMAIALNASFSTCTRPQGEAGKAWKPDWLLKADKVEFDVEEDVATASGAQLRFKDVPILAFPSFSFPMSDKRKSGFLPPSVAQDSQSGFEYTQPYYWNIAPHMDLMLIPSYMEKRGLNMGAEYRYLQPNYTGQLRLDYSPSDKLVGDRRWGYALDHRALMRSPFDSAGTVNWRLQMNRVSDDNYWRDFPRANAALTQRLLANEFSASTLINGWQTQIRAQRWQTLQDATAPITPPFDRVPQLTTRKAFYLPNGIQAQVEGDFTSFNVKPDITGTLTQPNGKRAFGVVQISRPWLQSGGFITPKLQLHGTAYQLQTQTSTTDTFQQRFVPTFSLDSGLFFERETNVFGKAYSQTLEPRAFYVYTPYRDQSVLPNYDSGAKDFTLSTIYSENPYVGNDRIADMQMLTLGLTTRLLNPATGAEVLRAGVAQRYRMADQLVTLPGEASITDKRSDWLVHAGVTANSLWAFDGTVQFGAKTNVSERTTLSTRFNPSNYRALYAAYRMQKDVSEQIDVGWQWPIGDLLGRADEIASSDSAGRGLGGNRWYSVGRLNYSAKDQRLVNAIMGFEYDADCWIGRIVLEQTQLDVNTTNQRVMFQVEFVGFSRLGISPLASLRRNIPRYQNLREQIATPSRFSQYD